MGWLIIWIVSMSKVDKVKRPDHYQCLECHNRFNDALLEKEKIGEFYYVIAKCPNCRSSKLKISWWRKEKV
ncbi:MAG: hypothetical protein D6732_25795 [Methanobacteriota archaeon]|nr:MAG: hypothetical protein D6732_25795 [Euryarchaeota archaeon]